MSSVKHRYKAFKNFFTNISELVGDFLALRNKLFDFPVINSDFYCPAIALARSAGRIHTFYFSNHAQLTVERIWEFNRYTGLGMEEDDHRAILSGKRMESLKKEKESAL